MQFEEFDNKIREAAENHHPAYDEQAWGRMEKLLNKHLPQEDNGRRRFIFFLFLVLLLGGGSVWLFSSKPWRGNKPLTAANTTIQKPTGEITAPISSMKGNSNDDTNKLNNEEIRSVRVSRNDKTITGPPPPDQIASLLKGVNKTDRQNNISSTAWFKKMKQKTGEPFPGINKNPEPADNNIKKDRLNGGRADPGTTNSTAATFIPDQKSKNKEVAADNNLTTTSIAKSGVNDPLDKENSNKDNPSPVQNSPENKTKGKTKKKNTFFITLSAGPDRSATGGDKLGKTKLLAGGGLGYTFKDRLTIRSGFYTGRKIYTSSPASYHPPANFWNYYPNLEKVDADCRVYEIPLSLSYNFGHSSKQNWFVSAGISSYLMKKETYNYYYKYTAGGPTLQRKWTIKDENKHYFSVLTLSGGYQKNIGKNFSIMVEPYFKLPLSGVGFGKVKLNSGGLLFSLGIKPFNGSGKKSKIHR